MANTIARSGGAGGGSFDFIKILLRGTGQVMFQNSAWTGLLFMIGIFWGAYAEGQGLVGWGALLGVTVSTVTGYLLGFPAKDGEQGLWGFNGVLVGCAFPTFMGNTVWMWRALALLTVVALKASGSDISDGLYGYSPVLTAIALATVFYKPNFRSALWAVLGILVTVFIQAGMYMLMAPVGIATLTGPFCITTWLFLLPLVRFDDEEKPDHSNWYPENKKHLAAQQPGAKTE